MVETQIAITTKGYPQVGSVISTLLWSLLVADELLELLNSHGFEVQEYADNIVITWVGSDLMSNKGAQHKHKQNYDSTYHSHGEVSFNQARLK